MGWVNAASAIGFVVGALMTMFFSYVMGNIQDYYLMPFYGGFFICFINTLLVMYCVSETYTPKKLTDKLFEFNFSKNLYSLLVIFVQLEIAWGICLLAVIGTSVVSYWVEMEDEEKICLQYNVLDFQIYLQL